MSTNDRDADGSSCDKRNVVRTSAGPGARRENSPNLDILRAVAVLTVVLDHLVPTLNSRGFDTSGALHVWTMHVGQAGVLAFFVHTSLVLMYSLERLPAPTEWARTWRFYVRRLFRIYPLAVVCVLGMLVVGWPDAPWRPYVAPTGAMITSNLLLIQNLWTGYSILTPLWSLPYEVEMYLVLPMLFWVARHKHGFALVFGLLVAASLGGYALHKLEHGHMNLAAYVPCFLAGVCCYRLRDRITPWLPGWTWVGFVVLAIVGYCGFHRDSEPLRYWYGWVYCICIALAIPCFADSQTGWLNRAAASVAKYSYGIYLLHVPALHLVYVVWRPPGGLAVQGLIAVAITAVAAVAAYHVIEEPLVRMGRRLSES